MILAILILAFLAGSCITGGVTEDSPGSVVWGVLFLAIACVFTGVMW